jgi:hypothetical protein
MDAPLAEAELQARAEGLVLARASNATGFKGVYRDGGRFQAATYAGGRLISLGRFSTPEAAALAYARHLQA